MCIRDRSSAALILRKHPSLLLSLRSFHWGSSAVARWRKSPSTLLLPLSTKSSRTASLRCVWCQHDSDLDCLAVGVAYLRCSIKLWLLNWREPALIVPTAFQPVFPANEQEVCQWIQWKVCSEPIRSFLLWLHCRHQFQFPASKFRVLLALWFGFLIAEIW